MTMVSEEVAGAKPAGADACVFRPAGEMVIGLQVGAAAVAALSLAVLAHQPSALQAPTQDVAQALRPAAQPARAPVTGEGLADPPEAALAPRLDSRVIVRNLLKEAGLRPSLDLHRLSWDQARKVNALLPTAPSASETAQPFHLNVDSANGRQALKCLTQAAYFEAGGNGPVAEAAVVQVVLNRVRHPDFPKSVCGVVYQGSDNEGCQFSFTCDGALARPIDVAAWNEARKVAARALDGHVVGAVGTATYYHADYVFPTWATSLVKMATVGPHIFYRMAGPAGAAAYFNGRYAGDELKLARAILRAGQRPKDKAQTQLAAAQARPSDKSEMEKAAVPAGLRVQAERLQRVHSLIAVAPSAADAAKVETASVQPLATVPAPAPAQPAPAPSGEGAVPAA